MKKIFLVAMFILLMISFHASIAFIHDDYNKHHKIKKYKVKKFKTAAHVKKSRAGKKIKKEKEAPDKGEESPKPLTGTFTMTTNYLFRGISQTNNTPAFQGGLTYTPFQKLGLYLSLWGSNVYMHVPEPHANRTATLEMDPAIGLKKTVNDNWSYDIHLVRYVYPRASVFEYNELIASLTYSVLTGLIGYSNNVFNVNASGTYYNLSLNLNIPAKYVYFNDVSLNGGVGYYSLPKRAGNSYMDYSIAVNKVIKNYTLTVQATNTNHKLLNNALDNAHLFGMVTASF